MINAAQLRRPLRAAVTALALGGVVAVLSACDRDFTATVSADQTVSGQVTFSTPKAAWDANSSIQSAAQSSVESKLRAAFPGGELSGSTDTDPVSETVTFTAVTFDQFEHAVDTLLGASPTEDGPVAPSSLTLDSGVYRFDAPQISPAVETAFAATTLNALTLTFPEPVSQSNGAVTGSTVVWDFVAHPELTSLHAATRLPSTPVATPKPSPAVSVASGAVVKKGAVRAGRRVRVAAPRALTPGTTVRYTWTVGGRTVATTTRPAYRTKRSQAGKRLGVQVRYSRPGYTTVVRSASLGRIRR